ncbi:4-hydroxybenzoate polyprenyltransferase [Hamadaea flava]|uniref:UbiA prenyltransferase family protein n=1 Tax=Hamadaea flava TaxID=1742688 RepID=A0ABV8LKX1_9ACTN|nr:UbiA prenyltransferase family protein [Hamadaea flava]MCP2324082.1 4-hydroxybenzoate polyprenyltransferase [Hamadaea flava]
MVQTLESPATTALDDIPVRFRWRALLSLLRPRHWIKGAPVLVAPLVTAPVAAAGHAAPLGLTLAAFLAASSTVYVLNDLRDRDADRLHPVKRLRALPSGRVTVRAATLLLVVLAGITAALLTLLPLVVAGVVGAYVAVNVWYSLALKHQPLVDVSVVAAGFVLRALAGTVAAGLPVRPFLLICVYCACVALSLGKRRHELAMVGDAHRSALSAYSVPFLDHVVVVNLVVALAGYVAFLWGLASPYGAVATVVTFPFATFTIYRYLQMVMVDRSGGDPVVDLVRDGPMRAGAGLWAAALAAVLIASAL